MSEEQNPTNNGSYSADSIQVLEDLKQLENALRCTLVTSA